MATANTLERRKAECSNNLSVHASLSVYTLLSSSSSKKQNYLSSHIGNK